MAEYNFLYTEQYEKLMAAIVNIAGVAADVRNEARIASATAEAAQTKARSASAAAEAAQSEAALAIKIADEAKEIADAASESVLTKQDIITFGAGLSYDENNVLSVKTGKGLEIDAEDQLTVPYIVIGMDTTATGTMGQTNNIELEPNLPEGYTIVGYRQITYSGLTNGGRVVVRGFSTTGGGTKAQVQGYEISGNTGSYNMTVNVTLLAMKTS